MVYELTFRSASDAVKNAYYKTAATTTALLASSAILVYLGLKMDKYYIKIAERSPDMMTLWSEVGLPLTVVAGGLIGVLTLIGAPITFHHINRDSKSVTTVDKGKKKIYQTRKKSMELADTIDYDAITSVKVNQGPLEKSANTGSVSIRTLRLFDDGQEGIYVEEGELVIPYQINPHEVRRQIAEGLPTHKDLVQRLRSN